MMIDLMQQMPERLIEKLGDEVTYYPKNGRKLKFKAIVDENLQMYDASGYGTPQFLTVMTVLRTCLDEPQVHRGDKVQLCNKTFVVDGVVGGDRQSIEIQLNG